MPLATCARTLIQVLVRARNSLAAMLLAWCRLLVASVLVTVAVLVAPSVADAAAQKRAHFKNLGGPAPKVLARWRVGGSPLDVALSAAGRELYVANWGTNDVSILNASNGLIIRTIPFPPTGLPPDWGEGPRAVVAAPDDIHAYVLRGRDNAVSVVNTVTGVIERTIPVGDYPVALALAPDGRHLYVGNYGYGDPKPTTTVSVVDIARHATTGTIRVGGGPWGVAASRCGGIVAVASYLSNSLSLIDGRTSHVFKTIRVALPESVAISPKCSLAYVMDDSHDTVVVVSLSQRRIIRAIRVGHLPVTAIFSPDGKRAYVANYASGTVSVIDVTHSRLLRTITVGPDPSALALSHARRRLFVALAHTDWVSVVAP